MRDALALDRDNIKEEIFLEIFEIMNKEELDIPKVTSISVALANFTTWIRNMMSYHILVHPYRVRNASTVKPDSDLY